MKATNLMINGNFLEMAPCHHILPSSPLNNVKNRKAESVLDLSPLVSVVTLFSGTGILFGSSYGCLKWVEIVFDTGIRVRVTTFLINKLYCNPSQHSSVYINKYIHIYGSGSSVGIVNDYGLDGSGSNPSGDEIFRPSRPALWPTKPLSMYIQHPWW